VAMGVIEVRVEKEREAMENVCLDCVLLDLFSCLILACFFSFV
jgi:hypothetical protein